MIPEIKTSNAYHEFETITGNRILNQKKIETIHNDINKGFNLLPYCPIIVYLENNKKMIVDGQHRFEVSKIIDGPIYYVETQKLTLQQIATLNSRQDKWKPMDFLRCYMKIGIEDYIILNKIMKKYKVGISTTSEFLMVGNIHNRNRVTQPFKEGLFKVNFKEETEALFELSHSLFDRYNFYTDRHLITAIKTIKEKGLCDFEILRQKIQKAPVMMDRQATQKDYIYNIERVYNYKNKIRYPIF